MYTTILFFTIFSHYSTLNSLVPIKTILSKTCEEETIVSNRFVITENIVITYLRDLNHYKVSLDHQLSGNILSWVESTFEHALQRTKLF